MSEVMELRPPEGINLADESRGGLALNRDTISHSSQTTFNACAKRFQLSYEQQLEPIVKGRPMSMGSAVHKGIELGTPWIAAKQLRDETPVSSQEDEDKLRVEEATVVAACTLYLHTWGMAPEAEFDYRVRLRSPWTGAYSQTYDLVGRADGLAPGPTEDTLRLVEIKFTSKLDSTRMSALVLDQQISLACYGIWRATGKRVAEVTYRFLRRPSIRQKQSETVDQFIDRLTADYGERPDFYSHEETLFRTDADLLTVEAELWRWAEQRREAKASGFYPRNTNACFVPYTCPFVPICSGQPNAIDLFQTKERRP